MTKRLKAIIQGIEDLKKLKWLFFLFGQKKKYYNILIILTEYKLWVDPDTYEMELFKLVDKYKED